MPPKFRGVSRLLETPQSSIITGFEGTFKKPAGSLNGGPIFHYQGDGKSWYALHLGGESGKPGAVGFQRHDANGNVTTLGHRLDVFDEATTHTVRVQNLLNGSWSVHIDDALVFITNPDNKYQNGTGGIESYAGCCAQGIMFRNFTYTLGNRPPVAVMSPEDPPDIECIGGIGTLSLDGSGSFDPDNDPISHAWEPLEAFDDRTAPKVLGTFPVGATTVTLTVSDGPASNSASVTVKVVDSTAPYESSITEPVAGHAYLADGDLGGNLPLTVIAGTKTVRAAANDVCGIQAVKFHVDGEERHADATAPYEFTWEAGSEAAGTHHLMVEAVDFGGHTRMSEVVAVTTVPTTAEGVLQSLVPG